MTPISNGLLQTVFLSCFSEISKNADGAPEVSPPKPAVTLKPKSTGSGIPSWALPAGVGVAAGTVAGAAAGHLIPKAVKDWQQGRRQRKMMENQRKLSELQARLQG